MKEPSMSLYRRLRIAQVRLLARVLILLGESGRFRGLLRVARTTPVVRSLVGWSLAYRKTYGSFAEAQQTADKYISAGHEHEDDVKMHTRLADQIRESDYPVFYHWSRDGNGIRDVFDFGGNIGNLFYSYQKYLDCLGEVRWVVYDIPAIRAVGERVARERKETRIHFADSTHDAAGCDLFLASGCLHYFEEPLPELLRGLAKLPRYVIANRTPVCEGPTIITVQDNKTYIVPCRIYNRNELIKGMEELGYRLREWWYVHELALHVPLYPESSSQTYSGFYFELQ